MSTVRIDVDNEATSWLHQWLSTQWASHLTYFPDTGSSACEATVSQPVVEDCNEKPTATPSAQTATKTAIEELEQFSLEQLPSVATFYVRPDGDSALEFPMRGLRANRDYKKGDRILSVPATMLVSANNVLKHYLPSLRRVLRRSVFTHCLINRELAVGKFGGGPATGATSRSSLRNLAEEANENSTSPDATKKLKVALALQHLDSLSDQLLADQELVIAAFLIFGKYAGSSVTTKAATKESSLIEAVMAEIGSDMLRFCEMLPAPEELPIVAHMSEEAVEHLGLPERKAKTLRHKQKWARKYSILKTEVFDKAPDFFLPALFTEQNWIWAMAIESSRAFSFSPRRKDSSKLHCRVRSADGNTVAAGTSTCPTTNVDGKELPHNWWVQCEYPIGLLEEDDDEDDDVTESEEEEDEEEEGSESSSSESSDGSSTSSEDDSGDRNFDLFTLVPFADMLNHSPFGNHEFGYKSKTYSLDIDATTDLKAGDQIFICYNTASHWKFSKYYGFLPVMADPRSPNSSLKSTTNESAVQIDPFTPFDNESDSVPFTVVVPLHLQSPQVHTPDAAAASAPACSSAALNLPAGTKSSVGSHESVTLLTIRQMFAPGNQLVTSCAVTCKGPNRKLITAYRLLCLEDSDVGKYGRAFDKEPISLRNEWNAYQLLSVDLAGYLTKLRHVCSEFEKSANGRFASCEDVQLACRIRQRDVDILTRALAFVMDVSQQLASLLYTSEEPLPSKNGTTCTQSRGYPPLEYVLKDVPTTSASGMESTIAQDRKGERLKAASTRLSRSVAQSSW